jgi:hypothetical protein
MGDYYHSRFHNPKLFCDQHFKKLKNLYDKDGKIYSEFHQIIFTELLRNILFYDFCSNMKFKRKEEFSLKNSTCKKLFAKQLKTCVKIKDEIKTDSSENDLFAFILGSVSSEQVEFLNFSDRIHEIARSLAFDQSFKSKSHENYANYSCVPTEDLLIQFFDIYFEIMMNMLDFTKAPSTKVMDYSRVY